MGNMAITPRSKEGQVHYFQIELSAAHPREGLSLATCTEVIPVRRFRTDVAFTIHFDGLPTIQPSG